MKKVLLLSILLGPRPWLWTTWHPPHPEGRGF